MLLKYGLAFGVISSIIVAALVQRAYHLGSLDSCESKERCGCKDPKWGVEVLEGEGCPANIQRISKTTVREWLTKYYAFGRPVIVTDASSAFDELNNLLSDDWLRQTFGRGEETTSKTLAPDISSGDVFETDSMVVSSRVLTSLKSNFSDAYFQLPNLPSQPFRGLYKVPYFLPQVDSSPSAYIGGHGLGMGRHQDYYSCYVAWQAQLRGTKRWTLQSPLAAPLLESWPDEAFDDAFGNDKKHCTLIYDFEVHPGEVLVWPVQMFHNTTVTSKKEKSFSLTNHIHCGQMKSWARKEGLVEEIRHNFFFGAFWDHSRCHQSLGKLYWHCWDDWVSTRGVNLGYFDYLLERLWRDHLKKDTDDPNPVNTKQEADLKSGGVLLD